MWLSCIKDWKKFKIGLHTFYLVVFVIDILKKIVFNQKTISNLKRYFYLICTMCSKCSIVLPFKYENESSKLCQRCILLKPICHILGSIHIKVNVFYQFCCLLPVCYKVPKSCMVFSSLPFFYFYFCVLRNTTFSLQCLV